MSSKKDLTSYSHQQTWIAPSLLAADFSRLQEELNTIVDGGADILHVDIMDGHFVPNLSMGPGVVSAIRDCCSLPFDVHLMLSQPARYVEPFAQAGADHITIHIECEDAISETLELIRQQGCTTGLSLKPGTPVETLYPYLDSVDLVLVMTVEPGFGGQSFMPDMMPKCKALRERIDAAGLAVHVEVDGGVNAETSRICQEAGANMIVAGTSIFRAPQGPAKAITGIRGTAVH